MDCSHWYPTLLITISCNVSTVTLINVSMAIKQLNLETYASCPLLTHPQTSNWTFELLAIACNKSFNMLNITCDPLITQPILIGFSNGFHCYSQ